MDSKLKCLECGKLFVRPLSHVWQVHGLSALEYKKLHGLDTKRGIATEEYRERMRELVFSNGTIENLKKGAKYRFKKGEINNYARSEQTQARLKKHWARVANTKGKPASIPKIAIRCAECGNEKMIYPRQKREKNYCGTVCRNRGILKSRGLII